MKIQFTSDIRLIRRSALITQEFSPALEKQKMFFRFPFKKGHINRNSLNIQIKEDIRKFKNRDSLARLRSYWAKSEATILKKLNSRGNLSRKQEIKYKCILTFYGSYGYYETPNRIYLNIAGENKSTDFLMENLLHELLHLFFYKEIVSWDWKEQEKYIDSAFVKIFGNTFPKYKIQDFSKKS